MQVRLLLVPCLQHSMDKLRWSYYEELYYDSHKADIMGDRGFSEEATNKILVENPASALTFAQPA